MLVRESLTEFVTELDSEVWARFGHSCGRMEKINKQMNGDGTNHAMSWGEQMERVHRHTQTTLLWETTMGGGGR